MFELQVQKYLRSGKTLKDLETELGIKSNEYGNLVNLNYNQIDSPKTNPIVMECRQLILEKNTWNVVCRSFKRFFNYGEAPELIKDFNYSEAVALDKIDGSIISVFFYDNKWLMSTRGVIEGNCQVGAFPITFRELFYKTILQYPDFFKKLDYIKKDLGFDYCYTFELTSPENRVVTPYTERALTLLTVRSQKNDFMELRSNDIRVCADILGVKTPELHSFKDISDLINMAANVGGLKEGFVCVDYSKRDEYGDYLRIKVKNPAYLAVAHLKESSASSLRSMLQLVIMGEASEFLSYFPEYKKYTDDLQKKWDEYKNRIVEDLKNAKEKKNGSRKDYALWVRENCLNMSIMFMFFDGQISSVQDWIDYLVKTKGHKNFGKSMMEILKIKDMEWNGV